MKRLLFIVNVDWFFISHRLPIAISAIKEGCEVHIFTKVTSQLDVLERSGLIVHNAKLTRKKSGVKILIELFEIFSNIRKIKPDIVHLVTIKPVLLGGLASRILRIPAVVSAISGLGFVYSSSGLFSEIRRKLISFLYYVALGHNNQKVIFQNIDDQNRLVSINNKLADKSLLIPGSGVNLSLYSVKDIDAGIPIVMFAGRLLESKGVKEFVRSAELLNKNISRARFVLVGDIDPSNPESITKLDLDQWRKDGHVEIWGYRADMHNVIPLASVVVLPSYYGEGLPKVLIEAAACGRAVITTDHPGCRDAIESNVTGLLVPVKDAQTLADSIENLISNPEKCMKMGEAGRKLAEEKFDVQYVTERHISIYKNLLKTI